MGCGAPFVGITFLNAPSGCLNYNVMGDGPSLYLNRVTGGAMVFRENNVNQMAILSGGNVGIGTAAPVERLHVAGNIRVNGCIGDAAVVIGGVCISDIRYKKNIEPLTASLAKIAALRPVTYNWRAEEFPEKHFGPARSFGLIAQEVEQVLPEMVVTDEQGYKAVNYSQLPLYSIQAIKELKTENDALKARADAQQMEIEQLKGIIEQRLGVQVSKAGNRQ
ncbi:MAG: tail fiber domain-containing protein [Acidobacteria bacterium]|nr:tail fiber domain-containing protein [Acidobacteriota bacterium]